MLIFPHSPCGHKMDGCPVAQLGEHIHMDVGGSIPPRVIRICVLIRKLMRVYRKNKKINIMSIMAEMANAE